MFVVTVNFLVEAEFAERFTAAMLSQASQSVVLEPDCHVFDVCIATDDPCSIFLYEKYTDSNAFNVHLDSKHFKNFDTTVGPWVISKSVNTWTAIGAFS